MDVLEKILEEIEEKFKTADVDKFDCEELCDVEDWYDSGYIDGQLSAHEKCMDIIRSHMGGATDTDDTEEKIREHIAECLHRIDNIRSFIGSKEYTSNDEKCIRNIEVLKTSITALEEYLSSKKKNGNDGWIQVEEGLPKETEKEYYPVMYVTTSYGVVAWGFYRVKDEQWYLYNDIMEEFESVENNKIIAWQPLPEPYKPKKNIPVEGMDHIMRRFTKVE